MKLNKIALILMTSSCAYIGTVSASTAPAANKLKDCKASLFTSCQVVDEAVAATTKTNEDGSKTTIAAQPAMYSKQAAYPELFDMEGNSLLADSVNQVQKSTVNAIKNTLNMSNNTQVKLDSTVADVKKQKSNIDTNKKSIETNKTNINQNKDNIIGNKGKIGTVERNVQLLEKRISDFDNKMKRGFATQAALSGLFQPYSVGKFNLSAALGGYETTTAIALGTGYRFDEKVAAKAGLSTNVGGFDEISYNVGINLEW